MPRRVPVPITEPVNAKYLDPGDEVAVWSGRRARPIIRRVRKIDVDEHVSIWWGESIVPDVLSMSAQVQRVVKP